jgi:hypothetical protein
MEAIETLASFGKLAQPSCQQRTLAQFDLCCLLQSPFSINGESVWPFYVEEERKPQEGSA